MRRHDHGTSLVAAAMLVGLAGVAHADDECRALSMSKPEDADFQRCLKERPLLEVGAIGSLTLGGTDGFQWSVLGVVDIPLTRPLYLSARLRAGGNWSELDLLTGYVFGFQYGAGNHTTFSQSNTYDSPTAYGYSYTTTTTAHRSYVVQRAAWVALAGVKGTREAAHDGQAEATVDKFKTLQFGIARHYANHEGAHIRWELVGMKRGDRWGASLRWFNAAVGMEVGMQPMLSLNSDGSESSYTMFYWNFIDIGRFWDL
jgi:hypothetical protein